MLHVNWFVRTMKKTFNVKVLQNDVSYESYEFYHDELDDLLIPVEHLEKLPNPLIFETLMYVDENHNEWILGVVEEEGTRNKLYEVWIKNGLAIAYDIYID